MRTTEYVTSKGVVVRVHDPIDPGTPEWEARQRRWEKAVADCMRSEWARQARKAAGR